MADVNHVILIGRLTRDAALTYTAGGYAVCSFSIAVNRKRKNGDQFVDEASFFDINLYGKSAESLKQYLVKGKQIAVEGELRQDRWEQDGQQRSKVVIAANNIQLLGGNSVSIERQDNTSQDYPKQRQEPAHQNDQMQYGDDSDFPENIPF
jgi:single-strand DNA-binding protein